MDIQKAIEAAEPRIRAAGYTITGWCAECGIGRPTWYGWKEGRIPDAMTWHRVEQLISALPVVTVTEPRAAE